MRPGSQRFFPLHHSNNIFYFLLAVCIFSTPTDEIAVHSLEKRSQSKFCKNRARCCLWKWTYLRLSINTAVRAGVTCSSLVCWPDPGTPRGSHCCCYSNLTLIYFQEINIGLSSVSYLHAVTAQTASVCVHSVNPGFLIDLDHKVLKGHFCINILNDQLSPFCLQYNIL